MISWRRSKMKKLALILALVFAFGVVGCGEQKGAEKKDDKAKTEKKEEKKDEKKEEKKEEKK
jgi:hypothetical protein